MNKTSKIVLGVATALVLGVCAVGLAGDATPVTTQPTPTTQPATVDQPPSTSRALPEARPQPQPTTTLEQELSWSTMQQLWLLALRDESRAMSSLTWVDVSTDAELLEVLDVICDEYNIHGTSVMDVSLGLLLTLNEMYGDAVNDDDVNLAGFAAGAAEVACEARKG